MKRPFLSMLVVALALNPSMFADEAPAGVKGAAVKLRIVVGATILTARLEDSATARDFASLLPLTLTLRDYAATDKISDLPRRLSTEGAPAGIDPSAGDIAYYAPWGNLALFYTDFAYSGGLVLLGKLDSGVDVLVEPGPVVARLELDR